MSSHESPVVLTVAQRVKEYKMKTQQEVNIIVAKLEALYKNKKSLDYEDGICQGESSVRNGHVYKFSQKKSDSTAKQATNRFDKDISRMNTLLRRVQEKHDKAMNDIMNDFKESQGL
jgi:hypothetical protein